MRYASVASGIAVLLLLLAPPFVGQCRAGRPERISVSRASVIEWIDNYRHKPEPARVPEAVQALSEFGALRDPETAGFYVGFVAGVLGANPKEAERLVGKMLPLPPADQWLVVRAIAYSGLPAWKSLLARTAAQVPARRGMIDAYLTGALPTLDAIELDKSPTFLEKLGEHFGVKPKLPPVSYGRNPELLDTLWGQYFAAGQYRPIWRIITLLPWSKERDSAERLDGRQLGEIHARQQRRALSRHAGADQGHGGLPGGRRAADPRRGDPRRRDHRDRRHPQGAGRAGRQAQDQGRGLSARHEDCGAMSARARSAITCVVLATMSLSRGRPALRDRRRGDLGGAELLGGAVTSQRGGLSS